ncbi:hypothetical protein ACHQM5_002901 [Ranunculus cassubicifolius]
MKPNQSAAQTELVIDVPSTLSTITIPTISSSLILRRFHAGYFIISLSFCGQTYLWRTLCESPLNDHLPINLRHRSIFFVLLWSFSLLILSIYTLVYILRCYFQFKLVKSEYLDNVGVNYLYVPWISWLLLLQSSPFISPLTTRYAVMYWLFVTPVLALDVKIYGQWFTKGKRILSVFANPASQFTVIANLVTSQAASHMRWKETAMFFLAIGITHYIVLFVTLYQRPAGSYQLPARLRPLFFLFVATPSVASLAWYSVSGSFGVASKIFLFLSFFHFASLICRPILFRKAMKKFNIAWWEYSFPLSVLALASTEYAHEVNESVAHGIMLILLALSAIVLKSLIIITVININNLFADDSHNFCPVTKPVSIQNSIK